MSKRLIFLGPPGAGKGTQAERLAATANIPHISTGEIIRGAIAQQTPLGQKAKAYVDAGDLVPDSLILDLIRERLSQSDTQSGWILDGFPRNVSQAQFLDQLLTELHQDGVCVISLTVPEDVLVNRLMNRQRKDDNEATIRHRLVVYRQETAPVIEFYQDRNLHIVDGDRTPDEVGSTLQMLVAD
ncbi:adenylate kinase [Spirulina major CS-329]|uniref:adenylate kinase n=1 Tax=Spirulina TaxID=1154 RepID=UPI00232ABBA3|nr:MULTISPECIES: adenylate kinase [Spirulina]MDB9495202.1 adenylate kinase [Spirulina subsalsa CS-330]MDB9502984.1 adenylate kinase [Spirulina major CS-329]